MIIGYEGYSPGNKGIADRRRLVFWAEKRGHTIVESKNQDAEIIVITSSSDLNFWANNQSKKPLVLDVVDGLIGEKSLMKDYLRGFAKWTIRENQNYFPKRFSQFLITVAAKSQRVICSSAEQVAEWAKFGISAVDILDIHEEIPIVNREHEDQSPQNSSFFWEGLPATLDSMELLENIFKDNQATKFNLNILTNLHSYTFLNKYKRVNLEKLIRKQLNFDNLQTNITQWNVENLVLSAKKSSLGVIPIIGNKGYNHLKAENRLLIMWRLGLPVLVSPLDSYRRVMRDADIPGICENKLEWSQKSRILCNSSELQKEFIGKAQIYLSKRHTVGDILQKWDAAISF